MQLQTLFVIDDDPDLCASIRWMLTGLRAHVETFSSADAFLNSTPPVPRKAGPAGPECLISSGSCVLVDVRMPGTDGLQLLRNLNSRGLHLPIIVMSGQADVRTAVVAMQEGAIAFLEKPFLKSELLTTIDRAIRIGSRQETSNRMRQKDESRLAGLTPREREILEMIVRGEASKNIARMLQLSVRTVDKHREHILAKTHANSWAELVALAARLGIASDSSDGTYSGNL